MGLILASLTLAMPVQAAPVRVTVHLYRVIELHCDEGDGEACGNDYYPKAEIDHQGLLDGSGDLGYCCAHDADFRTNWVFIADIDPSKTVIDVHLELWDQDDLSFDDPIHWTASRGALDLQFNMQTCVFTGGGLTTQQGANFPSLAGQSEAGGVDSARGFFTITTPACLALVMDPNTDTDGDGIPNSWETAGHGLDINTDGIVDLALADSPFDALPYQKDLFVEVDYMAGDKPQGGALGDVVAAFNKAPVDPYPNPEDPTKTLFGGIALHAMESDQVPTISSIRFEGERGPGTQDDFDDLKLGNPVVTSPGACSGYFGMTADRTSSNCVHILNAKRQVFRYSIFGDSLFNGNGSSGRAELTEDAPLQGGNDFIVTIGSWTDFSNIGGRKSVESGTFMHEFGHTLSLGHGGGGHTNCKPNYLSVMNYTLQFQDTNMDPGRPLDYSNASKGTVLGTTANTDLDEAHLDENHGVYGTPADPSRTTVYGAAGKLKTAVARDGPTDWNAANGDTEGDISDDLNFIQSIGDPGKGCNFSSANQILAGFDDWAHIQYNPRLNAGFFADGVARPNLPYELTSEDIRSIHQKADLKITKSADQSAAVGGDTVTYSVAVTNLGPGTASNIAVSDTLPDGTVQQRSLSDLSNGAVNNLTPKFSYAVPCTATDGMVLTNSITVTGTDADGVPDPYTLDNSAVATTTVQAPVLTVGKTATTTVNAGEAITYTITYANTGTGGASSVNVVDTLPAGIYYSLSLDTGSGPKPNSVTLNADGTRTLRWSVGSLAAQSGNKTIVFTARPTLLAVGGTTYANAVSVSYKNAGGACTYAPVNSSSTTTITVVPPTRDPLSQGFWKNHPELWSAEFRARIQATDQRYDANADGALSAAEATAAFNASNQPKTILSEQLLATYFNLASRRINAGTAISSKETKQLGLNNVRNAVIYGQDTLALPVSPTTAPRYSTIIRVLDDINRNRIEVY